MFSSSSGAPWPLFSQALSTQNKTVLLNLDRYSHSFFWGKFRSSCCKPSIKLTLVFELNYWRKIRDFCFSRYRRYHHSRFPQKVTRLQSFSQHMATGEGQSSPSESGRSPSLLHSGGQALLCPYLDISMSKTHQCLRKIAFHQG